MTRFTNQEMYIKCVECELAWYKSKYNGVWDELDKVMALLYRKETEAYEAQLEIERLHSLMHKKKTKGELLKESIVNSYKKPDYGISYEN